MQINTFITTSEEWQVYVRTKPADFKEFGQYYCCCLLQNYRGEIIRLKGSWHPDQEGAVKEHQRLVMALKALYMPGSVLEEPKPEPTPKTQQCEHNWVMDGHNGGNPICSKCYCFQ